MCDDALPFDERNQSGVEFLLADLDLALTFMDIAATSGIEETAHRNHKRARYAYDTALRLLRRLTPDTEQRNAINAKMALLKKRLQAVGHQL